MIGVGLCFFVHGEAKKVPLWVSLDVGGVGYRQRWYLLLGHIRYLVWNWRRNTPDEECVDEERGSLQPVSHAIGSRNAFLFRRLGGRGRMQL
jgi:hypothetical protein